jgi:hypothetical protein
VPAVCRVATTMMVNRGARALRVAQHRRIAGPVEAAEGHAAGVIVDIELLAIQ